MGTQTTPLVAKKVSREMELFGDVRVDNYYWLRDDSRSNPDILSHLRSENAYTDFIMSGSSPNFGAPVALSLDLIHLKPISSVRFISV